MADLESLPETQGAYLEMTALCYQVFGEESHCKEEAKQLGV